MAYIVNIKRCGSEKEAIEYYKMIKHRLSDFKKTEIVSMLFQNLDESYSTVNYEKIEDPEIWEFVSNEYEEILKGISSANEDNYLTYMGAYREYYLLMKAQNMDTSELEKGMDDFVENVLMKKYKQDSYTQEKIEKRCESFKKMIRGESVS